jgi:RimJ/RimL family protein N-acetyltransferase
VLFPHAESARIQLKPATAQDGRVIYDVLFELGRTPLPTVDAYLDVFTRGVAAQFLIVNKGSGEVAGFTELSDATPAGHVQASVNVRRGQDEKIAADAAVLTVNFAFAMWRIRKVYFQTHEENLESLGFSGERAVLVRQEATLADHLYFQGRTWDMHIYSIQRERWDEQGVRLVKEIV